jgi:hypothetical protein
MISLRKVKSGRKKADTGDSYESNTESRVTLRYLTDVDLERQSRLSEDRRSNPSEDIRHFCRLLRPRR